MNSNEIVHNLITPIIVQDMNYFCSCCCTSVVTVDFLHHDHMPLTTPTAVKIWVSNFRNKNQEFSPKLLSLFEVHNIVKLPTNNSSMFSCIYLDLFRLTKLYIFQVQFIKLFLCKIVSKVLKK